MPTAPDPLRVIEVACLAALAEINRQRAGADADPPSRVERRKRRPARRLIPTSDICRESAKVALVELGHAKLVRRRDA